MKTQVHYELIDTQFYGTISRSQDLTRLQDLQKNYKSETSIVKITTTTEVTYEPVTS